MYAEEVFHRLEALFDPISMLCDPFVEPYFADVFKGGGRPHGIFRWLVKYIYPKILITYEFMQTRTAAITYP